jgi:hypothetical protein
MMSPAAWYQASTAKARTIQPPPSVMSTLLGLGADRQHDQADEDQPDDHGQHQVGAQRGDRQVEADHRKHCQEQAVGVAGRHGGELEA